MLRNNPLVDDIPRLRELRDRRRPTYAAVATTNRPNHLKNNNNPPPKQADPAASAMQDMVNAFRDVVSEMKQEMKNFHLKQEELSKQQAAQHASLMQAIRENTDSIQDQTANLKALESKVDDNAKSINHIISLPIIQSHLQSKHHFQAPRAKAGVPHFSRRQSQSLTRGIAGLHWPDEIQRPG